ncbi:type I pullulanase [Metabacillus sp. GX 13764]|uniref:type I pullulanase n=1 Tax=Metabacillus kandeliae TaxID=2900151 RepID=UPI001E3E295F|nr:type I pullulanase [Metabacillus kandeliae]MCD7032710.1 type I pullulanase [Metabacillus kandeliae]
MLTVERSFDAYLDDFHTITILLPKENIHTFMRIFHLVDQAGKRPLKIREMYEIDRYHKCICDVEGDIALGQVYLVEDASGTAADLQIGAVIRTPEFDRQYAFSGELGPIFKEDGIQCVLWAPTATEVIIKLVLDGQSLTFSMERGEKGSWRILLDSKYAGCSYTYLVFVNRSWRETVDPYAKAVTMNGGMGVLLNPSSLDVEKVAAPFLNHPADAIIYELHIRDFSVHDNSGMKHKGKYKAFTENNTSTDKGYSTGISYLKELGITHLELLPFNDFGGIDERNPKQYNWGYNPVHFNAPEGSYSTDPNDPKARILELKEAIQSIHQSGLKVMMDAVYNHVYLHEESSFEKIVPGYYFRMDEFGYPSNGTGVGNDIASERAMVRKFILDSVKYWIEEYDIDGIRFDLMGILDVETMLQVRDLAKSLKEDVLLIGEGWDLATPLPTDRKATISNAGKMKGIAFFNDQFRDSIKGSSFLEHDAGFALGNPHKKHDAAGAMKGKVQYNLESPVFVKDPAQSVNYVECHDNYTFWDKMSITVPHQTENNKRKLQLLAASIVLLSQGIPFWHAGQEFFRHKNGIENSYNASDEINRLDWNLREIYYKEAEYVKTVISVRKSHGAFRLNSSDEISRHIEEWAAGESSIAYWIKDAANYGDEENLLIIHKANEEEEAVHLPKAGEWKVKLTPFDTPAPAISLDQVQLNQIGTYVLSL